MFVTKIFFKSLIKSFSKIFHFSIKNMFSHQKAFHTISTIFSTYEKKRTMSKTLKNLESSEISYINRKYYIVIWQSHAISHCQERLGATKRSFFFFLQDKASREHRETRERNCASCGSIQYSRVAMYHTAAANSLSGSNKTRKAVMLSRSRA